ncbi:carbohydrate-binding domain-containing protein [Candidatus Saccharibacteria bacterium]|nr:carbohydrate-binding domain-containing protein [Candidatus Saccharibacteria bacterium]
MKRKLDIKWVVLLVVFIVVIVAAVLLNNKEMTANIVGGSLVPDNGDLKINWEKYPTKEITLEEPLTITQSGTYYLTGSLKDGSIVVSPNYDGVVKLVLDNVTINNSEGPAISCTSGDDLVIELVGENYLQDGSKYSSEYDQDVTGAIYSKADLTFQGEGSLNITANYQDAIVGKDDLKFNGGKYIIKSADDGIRGKDSVYIVNGYFAIESTADAIKSTNETDIGKGFVLIENGNFEIVSGAKGIKAINNIVIQDGEYTLSTYDDAIHSNSYVGIINGKITIDAKDDGIHANRELIIDGGEITVLRAYEGLEAQVVTINNGTISLTTTDDGINAGGGADSSATNRPGANPFNSDENCILSIKGGELYVNASGDGIDSNGWLYFEGGKTIVDGPTNNGNGALDAGIGISMSGGEVLAVGSSGMAESLGANSSVFNASIYLTTTEPAGTTVEIRNSAEETIVKHISAKTFSHLSVGTEKFILGETYSVYINGEKNSTFTISGIVTTVGNINNNQQMMPGGGRR